MFVVPLIDLYLIFEKQSSSIDQYGAYQTVLFNLLCYYTSCAGEAEPGIREKYFI